MIHAPVTTKIQKILSVYGIDPKPHDAMVSKLMQLVYDEREQALDEALGPFDQKVQALTQQIDAVMDQVHER